MTEAGKAAIEVGKWHLNKKGESDFDNIHSVKDWHWEPECKFVGKDIL